jgi:RND family efflux transporter MFP subunit
MHVLRKRSILVLLIVLVIGGPIAWYEWPTTASAAEASITAPVRSGDFAVTVTTTGELRARKFVEVQGPADAQMAGVFQTKISSIVPEGQIVQAGEVVAELDRSPTASRLADVTLNLQKSQADYTTAELDSALNLAQAREDVRTAQYALEEKQLAKEQSKYEAPTIQRQAEIDLEKAQRALAQSKLSLGTKTKQAVAKMSAAAADLGRQQNQLKVIQNVMSNFTIRAPAAGMVIYIRQFNGAKKGVGSSWSPWDPAVATLPDLTQMESDTYVNEIDVRKVAVGQPVLISLDADPSKQLHGTVTAVANVGEQQPNQDAKVFEVKIEITKPDTTLRPGMTTANAIQTAVVKNVLSVPLEAVISDSTGSFVYKRDGKHVVKQQITTGVMNDNDIIVTQGLTRDDRVLLVPPADKTGIETVRLPAATVKHVGSDTARGVSLPKP